MSILLQSFILIFLIQAAFFFFAAVQKTDRYTDLAYGLTFVAVAIYFLFQSHWSSLQVVGALMMMVWGVRLASYLFQRILITKVDKRFDEMRSNVFKFAQFWLLQAVSIWVISLPVVLLLSQPARSSWMWLSWLGGLIWLIGLSIETLADQQKFAFKSLPQNKDRWTDVGLWQYARHPNYFGEMLCWWGVFVLVLPELSGWQFASVASPLYITSLLLFVSGVPLLEKRYQQKFGQNKQYQQYLKKTRLLVPLPKRSI